MILIGDLHAKKNTNIDWQNNTLKFLKEIETSFKNEIIWFFGDVFNSSMNEANTYSEIQSAIRKIASKNKVYILRGNHDYDSEKDSLDIFNKEKNIEIYRDITELKLDNKELLIVPFMSKSILLKKGFKNINEYVFDIVKNKKYDYIFTHYTLPEVADHENETIAFKNLGFIVTGHIHIGKEGFDNGFLNLGTPYQTRYDEENKKSFIYNLSEFNLTPITLKETYLEYVTYDITPEEREFEIKDNYIYTINIICNNSNLVDAKVLENKLRKQLKFIRALKTVNTTDELFAIEESKIEGKKDKDIFIQLCNNKKENKEIIAMGLRIIGEVN